MAMAMKTEDLERLITGLIVHDDYREKNPEVDMANVFSISTLAYDAMKQFEKKMKPNASQPTNFDMFHGKSVHEFIQWRLRKMGFIDEVKLQYVLPYDWGIEELQNIVLIGHVDLWDPVTGVLIELKSSLWSDRISEYMIRQAAAYAYILRALGKNVTQVFIVKVNTRISVYELTDDDITRGWNEIEERAYEVARKLRNEILARHIRVDDATKRLYTAKTYNE